MPDRTLMHTTDHLIELALAEDIGPGDITTGHLVGLDKTGHGIVIAKEPCVIAGLHIAEKVFKTLDSGIRFSPQVNEGASVNKGETVFEAVGSLAALLTGERTALNFLQRLSGIATQARGYVNVIKDLPVKLVDTRKTTPGWRVLEKYAVRTGGAVNHRMGLYDGVMIKDNHIAVSGGVKQAVQAVKSKVSHLVKIEVEAATLDEVKAAVDAGADVIMLDNMDIKTIKNAVALINKKAIVEISGGVTRKTLRALGETGVDIISVGALTHSATAVDLSMSIEPA